MRHQYIARWDGFLAKIKERHQESIRQIKEATLDQLADTDHDYYATYSAMKAMLSQLDDLVQKIDETWETKVEPLMRADGDYWMEERLKGSELYEMLCAHQMNFARVLEWEISQRTYDHVLDTVSESFKCTQCHGAIPICKDVFREHYVVCPYCQATNTYIPSTKHKQLGWNIIDDLAAKATEQLYVKMTTTLEAIQAQRPPVAAPYWDAYEDAYMTYYDAYFKARIELNPELKDRYDDDMERKRREFADYAKARKKIQ